MSRALAQVVPQPEFSIAVLSGPDKGSVYRLMGPKVTIGRASENDVSIPADVKISRKHAKISFTPTGIIITNLTDNNVLLVNGEPEKSKILLPNAVVKIGETEFRFQVTVPAFNQPNQPAVRSASAPSTAAPGGGEMGFPPAPPVGGLNFQNIKKATLPRAGQKSPVFYLVIGLIGILAIYLFSSGGSKKAGEIALRTQEAIDTEIKTQEQQIQDLQDDRAKGGRNTAQYQQAQTYFVQGLRDYKQAQYERSMESFQACLSTFPNHPSCLRYQRLSLKKFNELIQYHMILGRRYKDQNQFAACRSSFRQVMTMVKDSSSEIYKESKVNFNLCKEQLEDRF